MSGIKLMDISTSMLEIAEISEGGNATIALENLTRLQKQAIKTLIGISSKFEGDIVFGEFDEATLRVINDTKDYTKGIFVSVIMPIDAFGKPYFKESAEPILI